MNVRARLFTAFLLAIASFYAIRTSSAAEDRVAVVGASPNVTKAISLALSPWSVRVVHVNASISTQDVAAANEAARALAREQNAGAVVWLAEGNDAHASLWMYDAETETVAVRPVAQAGPMDDAAAAAIALTVKTLLRSTAMAPPRERTAPTPAGSASAAPSASASAPSVPSATAPAASSVAPSSTPQPPASSAASVGQGEPVRGPQPKASSSARSPTWRVDAVVLGRTPTGAHAPLALVGGLAASFWPGALGGRFGAGLDFLAGPGVDVSDALFAGTFSDASFGATARARFTRASFAVEIDVRPALHWTSLSGTSLATARTLSIQRGDASLGATVVPELALGKRLAIGTPLGVDAFLRTQLYVLGSDVVLQVPTIAFDFGGRLSLALD